MTIFGVVMAAVLIAHAANDALKKKIWTLALLRVLEPAVVFYIVAGVIRGMGEFFKFPYAMGDKSVGHPICVPHDYDTTGFERIVLARFDRTK